MAAPSRAPLRRGSRRWWYYEIEQQQDFSGGMWRSVARHLIPPNGFYDGVNVLLDDDGSAYKRGGSVYQSGATFGGQIRLVVDVWLAGGYRTFFASDSAFGVLDTNDSSVVNLGGSGVAGPVGVTVLADMLFVDGGTVYGGSRKTATYSTGTITATNGSKVITGAGTSWSANADAGMLLSIDGTLYPAASVDSNTQITLNENYQGTTGAGKAYTLTPLGTLTGNYAFNLFTAANRLLSLQGNKAVFSNWGNPHVFSANDFHQLPDGVQLLGGAAIRDIGVLFSTAGVWAIQNLALALTDPNGNVQQRLEKVNPEMVLWNRAGIASWNDTLVVPALDGVYLLDGVSSTRLISRSITPLYIGYVRAGYQPGRAVVYRSHLFLPILNGTTWVDLLVCRLDRPVSTEFGQAWPWTHWSGHGGKVSSLARRSRGAAPKLLAGGVDARVLDLSGAFEPAAALKNDADATTPVWTVDTRDYATGYGNINHVRKVRIRYDLTDAAADAPTLSGFISKGLPVPGQSEWLAFNWGAASWSDASLDEFAALAGTAPVSSGRDPFPWVTAKACRYVRFRFTSSSPCAKLALRSLEIFNRQSGSDK